MNRSRIVALTLLYAIGAVFIVGSPLLERPAQGCSGAKYQETIESKIYDLPTLLDSQEKPTNAPLLLRVPFKGMTPQQIVDSVTLEVNQEGSIIEGTLSFRAILGPSDYFLDAQEALLLWRPATPWMPSSFYEIKGVHPLNSSAFSASIQTGTGPLSGVEPTQVLDTKLVRVPRLSGERIACYLGSPGFGCEFRLGSQETFYPAMVGTWKNGPLTSAEQANYEYQVEPVPGAGNLLDVPLVFTGNTAHNPVRVLFQGLTDTYCYQLKTTNLADKQSVTSEPVCFSGPIFGEDPSTYSSYQSCGVGGAGADPEFFAAWCASYLDQCVKDCAKVSEGCGQLWCNQPGCSASGGSGGAAGAGGGGSNPGDTGGIGGENPGSGGSGGANPAGAAGSGGAPGGGGSGGAGGPGAAGQGAAGTAPSAGSGGSGEVTPPGVGGAGAQAGDGGKNPGGEAGNGAGATGVPGSPEPQSGTMPDPDGGCSATPGEARKGAWWPGLLVMLSAFRRGYRSRPKGS